MSPADAIQILLDQHAEWNAIARCRTQRAEHARTPGFDNLTAGAVLARQVADACALGAYAIQEIHPDWNRSGPESAAERASAGEGA
ncbi:MAG TPA: hypothetical protein VFA45_03860 [Actinomycetes bacterium]|jgi:hypothetical protein|nr:hypothetical protein [Actinomycetes bacterium]